MTDPLVAPARTAIDAAADRLQSAALSGVACGPVRDLLGPSDIALAYEVQQTLTARRIAAGARIVGRKIGLTSEAVQRQVGVSRPDFGVLFEDMQFESDELIPMRRLLQPRAEAEIAFTLRHDILDASDPAAVRDAIAFAAPSLEIVDSRIQHWQIGITDTVADNASSGVFVMGRTSIPLAAFEPAEVTMTMERDGDLVSQGTGRACLGDPLNALTWLADTAIAFGSPLRAGDIILSGALGPMVPVRPGDVFTATISSLGSVTARFSGTQTAEELQ